MKLIIINGSSCVGKSTTVKAILKQRDRLYHLSYDTLKRSFSKYTPEQHIDDIRTLMTAVAETMMNLRYDIICDSVLWEEPRERLITQGKHHGYEIIEINLEAEYDILLERFDARVAHAKEHPEIPITNLSQERWKELYDMYQENKNPAAATVRTDTQSAEQTLAAVLIEIDKVL